MAPQDLRSPSAPVLLGHQLVHGHLPKEDQPTKLPKPSMSGPTLNDSPVPSSSKPTVPGNLQTSFDDSSSEERLEPALPNLETQISTHRRSSLSHAPLPVHGSDPPATTVVSRGLLIDFDYSAFLMGMGDSLMGHQTVC
jgi:hypothetical protein